MQIFRQGCTSEAETSTFDCREEGFSPMTLRIDASKCQGHGRCALIDGELFDVSDEGLGIVVDPQPDPIRFGSIQQAIDNCPEQAISWMVP